MPDSTPKKVFCISQQLSVLTVRTDVRRYLSGERFWQERHPELGDEKGKSPWEAIERISLVKELMGAGSFKRLAVVCAAGLGKSTNLEWLEFKLAALQGSRQVPFYFELDDKDLPGRLLDFCDVTLADRLRSAEGNENLSDRHLRAALQRRRASGHITLLLDSIDQATENGLRLLKQLLVSPAWSRCPIVVSARPHAMFDLWDELIKKDQDGWRFVRVEPLDEQASRILLNHDGIDRYGQLPPGGQVLMANPRHIEYVLKCELQTQKAGEGEPQQLAEYRLQDLHTASHVFAGAADHMVRYGMTKNTQVRKLGQRSKKDEPPDTVSGRQVKFALDLLAALAYTMYCQPFSQTPAISDRTSGDTAIRPNVSHVSEEGMDSFLLDVLGQIRKTDILKKAGIDWDYDISNLEKDLDCLGELNAEIKYDLLDTKPHRHGNFRWYDRSLQEFLAAWWLSRYAHEDDLERLRQWRYNDPRDRIKKSLYRPLWGFLIEMPLAVQQDEAWARAVGVLYEHQAQRCCEMIYRSCKAKSGSKEMAKLVERWQQEFRQLLDGDGPKGDVARKLFNGFQEIEAGVCPYGADSSRKIEGELIPVDAFQLHKWPVTNEMYKLFDPDHEKERFWERGVPDELLALLRPHDTHLFVDQFVKRADACCPVVKVTWFNAWCFATWGGYQLPTELQWEQACRAGSKDAYWFGNNKAELKYHAWFNEDWKKGSPHSVGGKTKNNNELYDMHGNVWEWCADWYDSATSHRVLRGGSWGSDAWLCRSAYRSMGEPRDRGYFYSFRLAAVPYGAK